MTNRTTKTPAGKAYREAIAPALKALAQAPETGQALQPSTGKANISGKARRGNKNFEALRKKGEVHKVTPDKNASPEKLRQVASSLKLTGPIDIRAIPSE